MAETIDDESVPFLSRHELSEGDALGIEMLDPIVRHLHRNQARLEARLARQCEALGHADSALRCLQLALSLVQHDDDLLIALEAKRSNTLTTATDLSEYRRGIVQGAAKYAIEELEKLQP